MNATVTPLTITTFDDVAQIALEFAGDLRVRC